jgi:hypothetical protein
VELKIETNGQRFDAAAARRLRPADPLHPGEPGRRYAEVYARQRPGGSLEKAQAACRAIVGAGLPLEITFAPTRMNIHEASAVIAARAHAGRVPLQYGSVDAHRHGGAPLVPRRALGRGIQPISQRARRRIGHSGHGALYEPFTVQEGLRRAAEEPPATLLVLPNGWVKAAAALPHVCADLRRVSLSEAWNDYRRAWREATMTAAVHDAIADEGRHGEANAWRLLPINV